MDDERFWVGPVDAPDTYQLITVLGEGGEGSVWEAQVRISDAGRSRVAIKILPAAADTVTSQQWDAHAHLLRSLDHPGVVRVREVFSGPGPHRAGTYESPAPGHAGSAEAARAGDDSARTLGR